MEYELHATENEIRNGSGGERRAVPPQGVPKTELAQLYFPQAGKKTALQGLARWIKRCTELEKALEAAGYDKNRRFYLKPEVELIVKFLGEP